MAYDYHCRCARAYVLETADVLIVSALRFLEAFALTIVSAPGPAPCPGHRSLASVESKSVRAPGWGARERCGVDGYNRVSGVKLHCAIDARGHLLACACSSANAHDGSSLSPVLRRVKTAGFGTVRVAVADGAHAHFGPEAAALGTRLEVTTVPECRNPKANGFTPIRGGGSSSGPSGSYVAHARSIQSMTASRGTSSRRWFGCTSSSGFGNSRNLSRL